MERPGWWPDSLGASARLLLLLCCVLLAGYQCLQLVELYNSEPVSLSLSFTPHAEVRVPSVTMCRSSFDEDSSLPENASVSEAIWASEPSLGSQLLDCSLDCLIDSDISYPGGRIPVPTGTWSSWMRGRYLCHTFMPNITWAQTPGGAGSALVIDMQYSVRNRQKDDRFLYVLPQRRPAISTLGLTSVERDMPVRVQAGKPHFVHIKVSSNVHERPSLRRAPCDARPGHHHSTCVYSCYTAHWAAVKNCSRPEMVAEFPQLPECPFSLLDEEELDMTNHLPSCGCLPACRQDRYLASDATTVVSAPEPHMDDNWMGLAVTMAHISQQVAHESLSF